MKSSPHFYRLIDCILARLLFRHISLNDFRDTTLFVNHALGLLSPVHVVVDKGDLGTMACKQDSSGSTIANFAFLPKRLVCVNGSIRSNLPSIRDPAPVTIATSPVKSNARGGVIVYIAVIIK